MNIEVNNMDIQDILSKALGIANNKKFTVEFFNNKVMIRETKEMTYLQLGTYLITNAEGIVKIKIFSKQIIN